MRKRTHPGLEMRPEKARAARSMAGGHGALRRARLGTKGPHFAWQKDGEGAGKLTNATRIDENGSGRRLRAANEQLRRRFSQRAYESEQRRGESEVGEENGSGAWGFLQLKAETRGGNVGGAGARLGAGRFPSEIGGSGRRQLEKEMLTDGPDLSAGEREGKGGGGGWLAGLGPERGARARGVLGRKAE